MSNLDLEAIVKLQVSELRTELSNLGLDSKGAKPDLLVRLLSGLLDKTDTTNENDQVKERASTTTVNSDESAAPANVHLSTTLQDEQQAESHDFQTEPIALDSPSTQTPDVRAQLQGDPSQESHTQPPEGSYKSVLEARINNFEDKVMRDLASLRSDFGITANFAPNQTMATNEAERLRSENAHLREKLQMLESQLKDQSQELQVIKEEKTSLLTALRLCNRDASSPKKPSVDTPKKRQQLITAASAAQDQKKIRKPKQTRTTRQPTNETSELRPSQEKTHSQQNSPPKTTVLLGDSMVKGVQGWKVGKELKERFVVKAFPGARVADMLHYVQPTLEQAPAEIVIHCGTNDLRDKEPKVIAESLIDLARVVDSTTTQVSISELVTRADPELDAKAKATNKALRNFCRQNGYGYIAHANIRATELNRGGIHLSANGNSIITNNFINFFKN